MGFLDNLENAWDDSFEFESKPISSTANMGRDLFWQDSVKPEESSLAVKIFSDSVCSNCSCK